MNQDATLLCSANAPAAAALVHAVNARSARKKSTLATQGGERQDYKNGVRVEFIFQGANRKLGLIPAKVLINQWAQTRLKFAVKTKWTGSAIT